MNLQDDLKEAAHNFLGKLVKDPNSGNIGIVEKILIQGDTLYFDVTYPIREIQRSSKDVGIYKDALRRGSIVRFEHVPLNIFKNYQLVDEQKTNPAPLDLTD